MMEVHPALRPLVKLGVDVFCKKGHLTVLANELVLLRVWLRDY